MVWLMLVICLLQTCSELIYRMPTLEPKIEKSVWIVYHFKDNDGNNWIILLTWNDCYCGKEPWRAGLWRCDENWKRIDGSPDNISDLLEEKEHTPGIVKDYFYLEEYKFLEERVLEIVRELKPELKDQL